MRTLASVVLACDPSTIATLPTAPTSSCIILESGDMRREISLNSDPVSTLPEHVSIRFFSIANK